MPQLVGAGKAQAACGGVLPAERTINQDRPASHLNEDILSLFQVIDRGKPIIEDCLPQDAARFPQALILQRDTLGLNDILNGDPGGNAIVKVRIISGDHVTGDPLQRRFPVKRCVHASVSLSSLLFPMRRLIRSMKSCHS